MTNICCFSVQYKNVLLFSVLYHCVLNVQAKTIKKQRTIVIKSWQCLLDRSHRWWFNAAMITTLMVHTLCTSVHPQYKLMTCCLFPRGPTWFTHHASAWLLVYHLSILWQTATHSALAKCGSMLTWQTRHIMLMSLCEVWQLPEGCRPKEAQLFSHSVDMMILHFTDDLTSRCISTCDACLL